MTDQSCQRLLTGLTRRVLMPAPYSANRKYHFNLWQGHFQTGKYGGNLNKAEECDYDTNSCFRSTFSTTSEMDVFKPGW